MTTIVTDGTKKLTVYTVESKHFLDVVINKKKQNRFRIDKRLLSEFELSTALKIIANKMGWQIMRK